VAGVMALYLGEKNYTPADLRALLLNSSTPIQQEGSVTIQQLDDLDSSSNFHLLYSGNWSSDGAEKVFEIASFANPPLMSTSGCAAAVFMVILTTSILISS
jgi:hypothetical protein